MRKPKQAGAVNRIRITLWTGLDTNVRHKGHRPMADNEQLEMLKKDVKVWNAWRSGSRGVEISLTGADLDGAHLDGADLIRANLGEANLIDAYLHSADLSKARNITVNQLVKTKTLYRAKMDSAIKIEIMKIKPELFEELFR